MALRAGWDTSFSLPASVGVQGAIRLSPCKFACFLRYPQSAYVQYAFIVCLENRRIS